MCLSPHTWPSPHLFDTPALKHCHLSGSWQMFPTSRCVCACARPSLVRGHLAICVFARICLRFNWINYMILIKWVAYMKIFLHLSLRRPHFLCFCTISLCILSCARVFSPHCLYVAGTQAWGSTRCPDPSIRDLISLWISFPSRRRPSIFISCTDLGPMKKESWLLFLPPNGPPACRPAWQHTVIALD